MLWFCWAAVWFLMCIVMLSDFWFTSVWIVMFGCVLWTQTQLLHVSRRLYGRIKCFWCFCCCCSVFGGFISCFIFVLNLLLYPVCGNIIILTIKALLKIFPASMPCLFLVCSADVMRVLVVGGLSASPHHVWVLILAVCSLLHGYLWYLCSCLLVCCLCTMFFILFFKNIYLQSAQKWYNMLGSANSCCNHLPLLFMLHFRSSAHTHARVSLEGGYIINILVYPCV